MLIDLPIPDGTPHDVTSASGSEDPNTAPSQGAVLFQILDILAEDDNGERYTLSALELPSGECVVPGVSDAWYRTRSAIELPRPGVVVAIREAGTTAWSPADLRHSLRGAAREFGKNEIPNTETLRAYGA